MDFLTLQVRSAIIGNYKHDRLYGRGKEYGDLIIKSAIEDVKKHGKFSISRHESKTGEHVEFCLDGELNVLMQIT